MTALDLPQISSKITFFEIIGTSLFQIKITASVRKSLRQDRGLCYFFFLYIQGGDTSSVK